ncbi:MAG: hypothetical protein ACT4P5_11580 [Armatimonadota bacterium]
MRATRVRGTAVIVIVVVAALALVALFRWLPGPGPDSRTSPDRAGFLNGLWHGIILPFTMLANLFTDSVSIYEVHNDGRWYNLGFFLGAELALGGGSRLLATRRRRAKRA